MENKNEYVTFNPFGNTPDPGFIFYHDGRMEKIKSFIVHSQQMVEFHTDNDMYMYKAGMDEISFDEDDETILKQRFKRKFDESHPVFYKRVDHIIHDTYIEDTMVAEPSISHIQIFQGKVYG